MSLCKIMGEHLASIPDLLCQDEKQQRLKALEARLTSGTLGPPPTPAPISNASQNTVTANPTVMQSSSVQILSPPLAVARNGDFKDIKTHYKMNLDLYSSNSTHQGSVPSLQTTGLNYRKDDFSLQLSQSSASAMQTNIANESSNLSSAGSTSDPLNEATPEKMPSSNLTPFANFGSPSSHTPKYVDNQNASGSKLKSVTERKRKRRRQPDLDDNSLGTSATKSKVKSERKIERSIIDYMQGCKPPSLNRSLSNNNGSGQSQIAQNQQHFNFQSVANVDGELMESQHLISPGPSNNMRTTPTQQIVQYASSEGSASNQSPPNAAKHHMQVQTELTMDKMLAAHNDNQQTIDCKSGQIDELHRMIEELKSQLNAAERQIEERDSRLDKCRDITKNLLIDQSKLERKQVRERCTEGRMRLGQPTMERKGATISEVWVEGSAFQANNEALKKIKLERESMEESSKMLKKRKPNTGASAKRQQAAAQGVAQLNAPSTPTPSGMNIVDDDDSNLFAKPEAPKDLSPQEYYEQDEIYRLRREALKKEEAEVIAERDRLEREYKLHQRELKRLQNEDASRYKDHVVLGNYKYLLISLLGKGGFSEVWKAFDLEHNLYVACKIHHVNKDWKEDKKCNYVKHATREMKISETLYNSRIVQTYATVTIDKDSFFTVLEYCDGNDLDIYLKQNKMIAEKEARSIIMQVVSGLKYLNERKPPVIHYDLKPANILLQSGTASGEIKITDFGLSKVMAEDSTDDGMTLTSPGAGTYWYLPPECFATGIPPKINSKVDVWSVGVIFYQCLYGKRPFGDEMSQSRILQDKVILRATEVTFPAKPTVSNDAKAFIRCCLQYRKEDRADVFLLAQHEYLRPKSGKASAALQAAAQQQQQTANNNCTTSLSMPQSPA